MDTFVDGAAIYRTNNSENHVMADLGPSRSPAGVCGHPCGKSGNVQNVLAIRGTSWQAAVQPLWDGLTIEDLNTRSEYGEITFTIVGLSDFSA